MRPLGMILVCLTLSGCVSAASDSARQLDGAGDVEITTVACASQAGGGATCPLGNSMRPAGSGSYQLLLAYRVPAIATAPESVIATEAGIPLALSPSYSSELQRLAPAGDGRRWAGYISPRFDWGVVSGDHMASLVSRFGLVRFGDGAPFPHEFRFRSVLGFREADPDPGRPVSCGDSLTTQSDDGTLCQDWPAPEELASEAVLGVHDLGILTGARAGAPRGGSGKVPFTVVYQGAGEHPTWSLSATTSVPGGTAAPALGALTPSGDGQQTLPVDVIVPTTAAPGRYDVTLTAALPTGQVRTASGTLDVTGPAPVDRNPPEMTLSVVRPPRLARALRIGLLLEVGCSEPCRLRAQLRHDGGVIGRARDRKALEGRRRLRIYIGAAHRASLRGQRVKLRARARATDIAGNHRTRTVRVVLKR